MGLVPLIAWHRLWSLAGPRPRDQDRTLAEAFQLDHASGPLLHQRLCLPATWPSAFPIGISLLSPSVFVMGLCAVTFATGHILGHLIGADREQRAALTFGLGMSNNGTGLVLASVALASRPLVMLPIIIYNLTQHVVAGGVHSLLRRSEPTGQSRVLARINRNAHVAPRNSSYSVTSRMSQ